MTDLRTITKEKAIVSEEASDSKRANTTNEERRRGCIWLFGVLPSSYELDVNRSWCVGLLVVFV